MPLQNRVRPDGAIVADPARGTLMGNRGGRIHDPDTKTLGRARWSSRAWICCALAYKDLRHDVFGRTYTALFFLDEVTALAAGHRPCVLCRRAEAFAYRASAMEGLGLREMISFPDIDCRLNGERRAGREKKVFRAAAAELPSGAMVRTENGACLALHRGSPTGVLRWSFEGYVPAVLGAATVDVLTPPTTLAALRAGYTPRWHASALTPSAR